ncbi:MAG: hypothetical protein FJ279_09250 [Planctomycetes bacterium]|nr:hypothetical protein [Planctomycetota bacterium]
MKNLTLATALLAVVWLFSGCDSGERGHAPSSAPEKTSADAKAGHKADEHAGHEHGKAEAKKSLPDGANKVCPVSNEKVDDPDLFVEYQGERIYLCCKGCVKRAKEDLAAAYAKAYPGKSKK